MRYPTRCFVSDSRSSLPALPNSFHGSHLFFRRILYSSFIMIAPRGLRMTKFLCWHIFYQLYRVLVPCSLNATIKGSYRLFGCIISSLPRTLEGAGSFVTKGSLRPEVSNAPRACILNGSLPPTTPSLPTASIPSTVSSTLQLSCTLWLPLQCGYFYPVVFPAYSLG